MGDLQNEKNIKKTLSINLNLILLEDPQNEKRIKKTMNLNLNLPPWKRPKTRKALKTMNISLKHKKNEYYFLS